MRVRAISMLHCLGAEGSTHRRPSGGGGGGGQCLRVKCTPLLWTALRSGSSYRAGTEGECRGAVACGPCFTPMCQTNSCISYAVIRETMCVCVHHNDGFVRPVVTICVKIIWKFLSCTILLHPLRISFARGGVTCAACEGGVVLRLCCGAWWCVGLCGAVLALAIRKCRACRCRQRRLLGCRIPPYSNVRLGAVKPAVFTSCP